MSDRLLRWPTRAEDSDLSPELIDALASALSAALVGRFTQDAEGTRESTVRNLAPRRGSNQRP